MLVKALNRPKGLRSVKTSRRVASRAAADNGSKGDHLHIPPSRNPPDIEFNLPPPDLSAPFERPRSPPAPSPLAPAIPPSTSGVNLANLSRPSSPTPLAFDSNDDLIAHLNELFQYAGSHSFITAPILADRFTFTLSNASTPATGNLDKIRFLASLAHERRYFPDCAITAESPFAAAEMGAEGSAAVAAAGKASSESSGPTHRDRFSESEEEALRLQARTQAVQRREDLLASLRLSDRDAPHLVRLVFQGTHTGAPYAASYGLPPVEASGAPVRSSFLALVKLTREGAIRSITRLDAPHPLEVYRQIAPPGSERLHFQRLFDRTLAFLFHPEALSPSDASLLSASLDQVDLWSLRRFDGSYHLRPGLGRTNDPSASWPSFLQALRASFPDLTVTGESGGLPDADMVLSGTLEIALSHRGLPFTPTSGFARGIAPPVDPSDPDRPIVLRSGVRMLLGPEGVRKVVLGEVGPFAIYVMAAAAALSASVSTDRESSVPPLQGGRGPALGGKSKQLRAQGGSGANKGPGFEDAESESTVGAEGSAGSGPFGSPGSGRQASASARSGKDFKAQGPGDRSSSISGVADSSTGQQRQAPAERPPWERFRFPEGSGGSMMDQAQGEDLS